MKNCDIISKTNTIIINSQKFYLCYNLIANIDETQKENFTLDNIFSVSAVLYSENSPVINECAFMFDFTRSLNFARTIFNEICLESVLPSKLGEFMKFIRRASVI